MTDRRTGLTHKNKGVGGAHILPVKNITNSSIIITDADSPSDIALLYKTTSASSSQVTVGSTDSSKTHKTVYNTPNSSVTNCEVDIKVQIPIKKDSEDIPGEVSIKKKPEYVTEATENSKIVKAVVPTNQKSDLTFVGSDCEDTTEEPKLLFVKFNQEGSCVACGTSTGFTICHCESGNAQIVRRFKSSISHIEMLMRTNIICFVGGGYNDNKVILWDDHLKRALGQITFRTAVCAIKLRRDRIIAILENRLFVYNINTLKLLDRIETSKNSRGACDVTILQSNFVLACPGLSEGHVRVELYDYKKTVIIPAHKSKIRCFALNYDGSLLATCSEKGTTIRVFDSLNSILMHEFRRGIDQATIYNLAFNRSSKWLALTSDKGTLHLFSLTNRQKNTVSVFSQIKNFLPQYFSSQWSFSKYKISDEVTYITFDEFDRIVIVTELGDLYRVIFNEETGEFKCTEGKLKMK